MASLWSDRSFDNKSDLIIGPTYEHPSNLTSILAAARNQVPLILPESLAFEKAIGKGSTFEVSKELFTKPEDKDWSPYYVAVKHMIVGESDASRLQRHYDSVHRELRVLTHPGLRDHNSILTLIAYGWTNGVYGRHPYLVVEWSDHGTLTDYLRRISPSVGERRGLALDVATGLKALHESKIIHGDLKPSNILVFDTIDPYRPQMAKLADFGGSIFELDENQIMLYRGTAIYNAPEQERRGTFYRGRAFTYQEFYQADIYSFGLTVWEILKNGHEYIEEGWLKHGETKLEALNRICDSEKNGVLERAKRFCEQVFRGQDQHTALQRAILETFNLTLSDDPQERSSIGTVIEALAQGAHHDQFASGLTDIQSVQRPQPPYPSIKIGPSLSMKGKQAEGVPEAFTGYKLVVRVSGDLSIQHTDGQISGSGSVKAEDVPRISQLATVPAKPPAMGLSQFRPGNFDLFQTGSSPSPPWEVQHDIVDLLLQNVRVSLNTACMAELKYLDSCLQLALCYHIGFGVRPNLNDTFHFLTSSLSSHEITKALYKRIVHALGSQINAENVNYTFESDVDKALNDLRDEKTYFATRISQYQRAWARHSSLPSPVGKLSLEHLTLADVVSTGDLSTVSRDLSAKKHGDPELSKALYVACQRGDANAAMLICQHCKRFISDPGLPSPLHWLIVFDEQHVEDVASALVRGLPGDPAGPCKDHMNYVPSAGHGVFYFPEHCAEFYGSPLHWAVRARNLKLVRLLVRLGADINSRWSGPKRFSSDASRPGLPYLSPLDIAVLYHLPEVTQTLIELGADLSGGAFEEQHSAFQCIGQACVPLSRYIIHGKNYRNAMKNVMEILVGQGSNILEMDSNGYDPLMTALRDPDCEAYVIQELLCAGAQANRLTLDDGSNAAILAARNSLTRRHKSSNLALVANLVADINEQDATGKGAIHYAAIGGSDTMAEILIKIPMLDINARASNGQNALHFAAMFGSGDVISILIDNHAEMEVCDAMGLTALQLAVFHHRTKAADLLLELGAEALFTSGTALSQGSILHIAAAGAGSSETMVRHLLITHPKLQLPAIINHTGLSGWTALHKAAYFGDYDAIDALLDYGADRTLRDRSRGPYPGRTALDVVERLLKQVESRGLGVDHERVKRRGQQAEVTFTDKLKEIKRILEDDYQI